MFGCFRIEGERDKANETGLKEGEGIEIKTTVLSIYHIRDASSVYFFVFFTYLDFGGRRCFRTVRC